MINGNIFYEFETSLLSGLNDNLILCYDSNDKSLKNTSLSNIYIDILRDFVYNNNVSSMAFEDKNDYMKINHDHDIYTSAEYENKLNGDLIEILKVDNIGNVLISNVYFDYSDKKREVIAKYYPKFGTLKTTTNKNAQLDITSENFDGWVYADGKEYYLSDFNLTSEINTFYGNNDGLTFTVPKIEGFIKYNNDYSKTNCLLNHNGHVSVPVHKHDTKTDNLTMSFDVKINSVVFEESIVLKQSGVSDGNTAHNGKPDKKDEGVWGNQFTQKVNVYNIPVQGVKMEERSVGDETYPTHVYLMSMIYIGLSKYSKVIV